MRKELSLHELAVSWTKLGGSGGFRYGCGPAAGKLATSTLFGYLDERSAGSAMTRSLFPIDQTIFANKSWRLFDWPK